MNRKPIVILTGPTAVGKSDLSIKLCKAINGAVISADSMQVYRGMDIGSAKIMPQEMLGIPHYLIDCLDPKEPFSIVEFQKMAKAAMEEIYSAGQIPVVVGGTGFYIQALLYDIDFSDENEHSALRERLEQEADEIGAHAMHEKLKTIDLVSYETIHENNIKRVIRAIEYYEINHSPISKHNAEQRQKESAYDFAYFVLNDDRATIYSRIDQRVDVMVQNGLLEEVTRLRDAGCTRDLVSMQGLGYKEILDYLNGEYSLEHAIYLIKRDSRHFAKRQITWFKREKEVIWMDKREYDHDDDRMLDEMIKILKEKNIYG
ncbi:MAG: tRNA (adenosine(37)-N6)-dimethylallyltransferase MiaA [Agathobacter sp.]|uniref:tRNA (adenosine(37)-N6)-dimethylallyltransferase MiaA n=1 Tax=Agathobacter sp. TaxID=2021311 RepID=UPI00259084EE|nr:tRNA (adenosine(37)-N6)-dimethylallyltransferase MiaA [Agathobacter sp.]MCR5677412.1 tRNA (adenosine(37)-N6)-dimethylallyltransferase MiaA [Agathobacter sp.]